MIPVGSLLHMHILSNKNYNTYPLIEWNVSTSRGLGTRWWLAGALLQKMIPVGLY